MIGPTPISLFLIFALAVQFPSTIAHNLMAVPASTESLPYDVANPGASPLYTRVSRSYPTLRESTSN